MAPVEGNKLTAKYGLINTGIGKRRVGKLECAGIEGDRPIRIPIRRTNPFDCEVGLKDRIEGRVEPSVRGSIPTSMASEFSRRLKSSSVCWANCQDR